MWYWSSIQTSVEFQENQSEVQTSDFQYKYINTKRTAQLFSNTPHYALLPYILVFPILCQDTKDKSQKI